MADYYDRKGKPITFDEYLELKQDLSYPQVELTTVGDITISTVWLGLDHRFGRGRPYIFETMAGRLNKAGGTDWSGIDSERYSTEEEARVGHQRFVRRYESDATKTPETADAA